MPGVRLTTDAARMVGDATRYTLANRSILGGPPAAPASPTAPVVALCTSSTTVGAGLYPGLVADYLPAAGAWLDGGPCLLKPLNGEAMVPGDYYLAMPCGQSAAGTPLFLAVVTCCGGGSSGSGSGGGGGGGIITMCCPGVAIPKTLYAKVSGAGACDGVYELRYDPFLSSPPGGWSGPPDKPVGSCVTDTRVFSLQCMGGDDNNTWRLIFNSSSGPDGGGEALFTFAEAVCDPFGVTFDFPQPPPNSSSYNFACCDITSPFTVTITVTDPSGGGGGGGSGCFPSGSAPGLTATVTDKVGCYTALPSTMPIVYNSVNWNTTATGAACSGDVSDLVIFSNAGTPTIATVGAYVNTPADPGFSCSPIAWVFHVDDGAGNSCTITVS